MISSKQPFPIWNRKNHEKNECTLYYFIFIEKKYLQSIPFVCLNPVSKNLPTWGIQKTFQQSAHLWVCWCPEHSWAKKKQIGVIDCGWPNQISTKSCTLRHLKTLTYKLLLARVRYKTPWWTAGQNVLRLCQSFARWSTQVRKSCICWPSIGFLVVNSFLRFYRDFNRFQTKHYIECILNAYKCKKNKHYL